MFRLVTDIEAYPQFLPWCVAASSTQPDEQTTVATLKMAKGLLRQSFTTRNVNKPGESIQIELVEGPFEYLQGCWSFATLGEQGSRVSLEVDFKFAHALVSGAFGKVFSHISGELVGAFCRRASVVYGRG
jgi:ribosome-associated toxin RatA of RatAB toxin-antitoxin module